MQQQAERLARRLDGEPDAKARIRKAYQLVFGRVPTDAELQTGLTFIATEPIKDYEERRNTKDTKGTKDTQEKGTKEKDAKGSASEEPEKPEKTEDSMMAGVIPGAGKKDDKSSMLPVTVWGRYVKILLSSNEFVFVN